MTKYVSWNFQTCVRSRQRLVPQILALAYLVITITAVSRANAKEPDSLRPNILWITSEDNGPELGCYGDSSAITPNIDALAQRGVRYNQCWSNAPVCAPARTTIITGVYATSFGASNMRSRAVLPENVRLLPELLREQGYYCTNNNKEDYNFVQRGRPWDESSNKAHWRNRPEGKQFFSVFNIGITHESQIRKRPHTARKAATSIQVPPYHPDIPEVRQDWAQYYDKIEEMDARVGEILTELEQDGLADSTIVFYFGDHGSGMPRSKRWLYQSGLRVPLVIHIPEKFKSLATSDYQIGGASDRLVSFVDLVSTVLNLSSTPAPDYLQGVPFLGTTTQNRTTLFGFRDRMDERIDMSRAIRDERYLYIRNFIPQIPQGVHQNYMFQTPTTRAWKRAFESGGLTKPQEFFWKPKPSEELYDLGSDPYQLSNLVDATVSAPHSEQHAALIHLREELRNTMIQTRDHGVIPESILKSDTAFEEWDWEPIVDAAFDATSEELVEGTEFSGNPAVRFWEARRLLFQTIVVSRNGEQRKFIRAKALELLSQSSPTRSGILTNENAETSTPIPSESIDGYPAARLYALGAIIAAESLQSADENESIASNEELGRFRGELLTHCDPRNYGLLHAIAALNLVHELAINRVRFPSDEILALQNNPRKDPNLQQVYQELISRLLEGLTSHDSR